MKKIIIFLVCLMLLISPAYASTINILYPENKTYPVLTTSINFNWTSNETITNASYSLDGAANVSLRSLCYQETATSSTLCGGLATGSYSVVSADYDGGAYAIGTIYINYTKPENDELNGATWNIKHGGLTQNITLEDYSCSNENTIQTRISSEYILSGITYKSYAECYNGTSWTEVSTSEITGGSLTLSADSYTKMYDGNWNTGVFIVSNTVNWRRCDSGSCLYGQIWEEAMYWNLSTNRTLNGLNYGRHNITVYNSDSLGNINSSTRYFHTTEGIININVYDEEAPTTPILSNLTITNGTTTLTYNNISSQPIYMEDIRGILTITANDYAGLYSQRQISATMESGQNKTENIYLLLDAAGFQIDLNVYDSLSTGITGALVNISRQSGYSYNYVTECTTDSAGYCFVTLNDTATYKFVVSKSGYITKTQYITPTLTAYSFTLQTPTPSINFTSELGGVTMLLTPQITTLKKSDAQPFNFTITSNETLTSWGMQILWQNYTGTSLFSSTKSNVTGGSVNATINTTLYNGTVVVRTFLQRDGYSLRSYYTNYTIHTITPYNHSLYNFIPDVQTNYGGTFSNLFITLALLLFIVFAAALFGLGTEVSGALLFIGLGYLSFFGLIPFNLLLLAMILFMSYILWKG